MFVCISCDRYVSFRSQCDSLIPEEQTVERGHLTVDLPQR